MSVIQWWGVFAPAGGTPEQFAAVIAAEVQRWMQVVRQANIKVA